MKIDIVRNRIKDPQKFQLILKTFEYFAATNSSREQFLVNSKDKEGIIKLLFDLINYIEPGLKKKFSQNFNVLITENGVYAIKFDPKEFLGLKYGIYDILVYKTPFICIPSQYYKKEAKENEQKMIQEAISELKKENLLRCFKLVNFNSKEDKITEDFIADVVIESVAFQTVIFPDNDLSGLAQLIQYEMAKKSDNYNWCVVFSKKILASQEFLNDSNVVYQVKFNDPEKKFHLSNKLNNNELFIYKKVAIFESVLKNIITGKCYDIELKHVIILVSLIIFVFLLGMCKSDLSSSEVKLTWFEENICQNKRNIFGGIGLMFIFAIIFGFFKTRMNKKRAEKELRDKKKVA
jgi:hypothetical protein